MSTFIIKCKEIINHSGRVTREFLITVIVSFLPILLGAIVTTCWSDKGLYPAFISNFSYGEVFLYTSAFLAPYAHRKLCKKNDLPNVFVCILALSSFVIGALAFSFVRMESVLSKKMDIPDYAVTYVGLVVITSTIIVWYYSIWKDHKIRIAPSIIGKNQQDRLNKEFDSLIGGK
ncbi:hypothetical protein AB7X32_07285 [Morganella morganii]|uniref:hypothetical protein n=2 Tax=Enterobacterales TaxID=91347 RepID=UPI0034E60656